MQIWRNVLAVALFILLVVLVSLSFHWLWSGTHPDHKPVEDIYQNLAVSVIISWIIFLIAYYMWAIQFYNINLGWTDKDWEKKELSPASSEKEPEENPNAAESLGLPPGTVRATIALSLLVAGLAMTIASFSMNNTFPANALFVDHFEFFKTAFLMMIAFYFGAKSLEILRNTNATTRSQASASASPSQTSQESSKQNVDALVSDSVKHSNEQFSDKQANG